MNLTTLQVILRIWLALVAMEMEGVLAVKISVISPVIVQLPAQKATLRCSFQMENETALFRIEWHSQNINEGLVLHRASSGNVFKGKLFKNTTELGDGCSLILRNPRLDNSGRYTAKVFVAGEGLAKGGVELILLKPLYRTVAGVFTTPTIEMPKAVEVNKRPQANTNDDNANQRTIVLGVVLPLGAIIIAVTATVIYRHAKRHNQLNCVYKERQETEEVSLSTQQA